MTVESPPAIEPRTHRFIGKKRRPVEDRRFVLGRGRFAADITLPRMHHVHGARHRRTALPEGCR